MVLSKKLQSRDKVDSSLFLAQSNTQVVLDQKFAKCYNLAMYKIKQQEFSTLAKAMAHARTLNEFVTIHGPEFEICGRFGVDAVENGTCPDGVPYDWNKASRIGRTKTKRS